MRTLKAIISGFAGAVALNILHETFRKIDSKAPRVDLVGEEALSKSLEQAGIEPPKGDKLHRATLIGDVVSNAAYYSLVGSGSGNRNWLKGAMIGLSAGIGALTLPQHLGLDSTPITKNPRAETLTVIYYTVGGLVAAAAFAALNRNGARNKVH